MKRSTTLSRTLLLCRLVGAARSVYQTRITLEFLTRGDREAPAPQAGLQPVIYVVLPLLHESVRVPNITAQWTELLCHYPGLTLVVVTTDRESAETGLDGHPTREALTDDVRMQRLLADGRAMLLHYPRINRTYQEQVAFAIESIAAIAEPDNYVYLTNADSQLGVAAVGELVGCAWRGAACAQQSALFLGNFNQLGIVPATIALFQSRWTLETEMFRYLVGQDQVPLIPDTACRNWMQHAVGHGLLVRLGVLAHLGGLPAQRLGLEDSALGYRLRAAGFAIEPMRTLELGESPNSVSSVLRQRATWVRGPLGAIEYGPQSLREWLLVIQAVADGLSWGTLLPARCGEFALLRRSHRIGWCAAYLTKTYAPLLIMVIRLPKILPADAPALQRSRVWAAVAAYWLAPILHGIGGFYGMARMAGDVIGRRTPTQPKTDGIPV